MSDDLDKLIQGHTSWQQQFASLCPFTMTVDVLTVHELGFILFFLMCAAEVQCHFSSTPEELIKHWVVEM